MRSRDRERVKKTLEDENSKTPDVQVPGKIWLYTVN